MSALTQFISLLKSVAPAVGVFVLAWRMRAVIRAFTAQGALSPESAATAASLGVRQGAMFRRFVRRGVLVSVGTDRFYLDERRYQEWRSTRRKRAFVMVSVVALIFGIALAAGWVVF